MICSSKNRERFISDPFPSGRILPQTGGVLGAHVTGIVVMRGLDQKQMEDASIERRLLR
jgi:hypothetical protein